MKSLPFARSLVLSLTVLLGACGGAASAPSASTPAASPQSSSPSAAEPAVSASAIPSTVAAASRPAASSSSVASAKPAASASAKPESIAPAKPGQLLAAYSEVVGAQAPLWGAKEGGTFQKNGLDVDARLIESSLSIGALLAGQVQVASVGGSEGLAAAVEGGDLKVLAITSPIYLFKLEVTSDIKKPEDLKGKKLAVSRAGSTSDTVTRLGLKKLGLDPDKDVSILQMGSLSARTAAMKSGAIQGSMTLPPDTIVLEDAGFHPLLDLADLKLPSASTGVVVQGAWLTSHRAEAQKYMDSIISSIARLRKDKPFALDVLRKYLKLDDQRLLEATYDAYVGKSLPSLPYPKPELFGDSIAQLSEKNPKAKTYDLNKLLDPSFVQSAADRGIDKG
jgi:NitT/TauT family transport system substrate-binding protein